MLPNFIKNWGKKRNEVTTVIFSKNRACQLDLLLRSLDLPATVLYKYDNNDFKLGYDKLVEIHPKVKFILESDFKKQLIELVGEYTMFLVDDDIMIAPFTENCPEFEEFKKNPEIICLSLRIAPYHRGAPKFLKNNVWDWRGLKHSWGYPMSASSHIFRKEDILPIMTAKPFDIPNDLEVVFRRHPPNRPLMICFDEPKIINNLANQVQTKYSFKNMGISTENLNKKFLSGLRISLEDMKEKAKHCKSCFLMTNYEYVYE